MQFEKARQRLGCLLALDVWIVFARSKKFEVGLIGRVILKNIKDEAFLDGLTHRVVMFVLVVTAENGQRLMLWSRSECEEAEVSLSGTFCHAVEQLFHVGESFFCCLFFGFFQ